MLGAKLQALDQSKIGFLGALYFLNLGAILVKIRKKGK
jgi:hypothetical protein